MLLIDAVVSALIKSFRARIFAAIFCLMGVAFLILLGATLGVVELDESVRAGAILAHVRIDGPSGAVEFAHFADEMKAHPILVALGVYGVTAVVSLPAAISASGKLVLEPIEVKGKDEPVRPSRAWPV